MNMNICETENRGFEMALNTRNIETKDFSWNSTVTFNYNKEEIKSLIDALPTTSPTATTPSPSASR